MRFVEDLMIRIAITPDAPVITVETAPAPPVGGEIPSNLWLMDCISEAVARALKDRPTVLEVELKFPGGDGAVRVERNGNRLVRLSPEQVALSRRVADEGYQWVLARTVSVYACASGGNLVPHGTGVLLRIADAAFILSAAHVLHEEERALIVGMGAGAGFVSLEGLDCKISDDRDDVDVGFARLTPKLDATIGAHKAFLRLEEVDLQPPQADRAWYSVIGFPCAQTRTDRVNQTIESEPFFLSTWLYEQRLVSFTEGVSIAVAFSPGELIDDQGFAIRPPELCGISGCGIWRMLEAGQVREPWEPNSIRLAGIEHTVVDRKAVKGILAWRVISAIRRYHPDLAPAIDLVRARAAAR